MDLPTEDTNQFLEEVFTDKDLTWNYLRQKEIFPCEVYNIQDLDFRNDPSPPMLSSSSSKITSMNYPYQVLGYEPSNRYYNAFHHEEMRSLVLEPTTSTSSASLPPPLSYGNESPALSSSEEYASPSEIMTPKEITVDLPKKLNKKRTHSSTKSSARMSQVMKQQKLLAAKERNNARCRNYRIRQKERLQALEKEREAIQQYLSKVGIHHVEKPLIDEYANQMIFTQRLQFMQHFLKSLVILPETQRFSQEEFLAPGHYACGSNFLNENLRSTDSLENVWRIKSQAFEFLNHNIVAEKTKKNGMHYEFEIRGKLRIKNLNGIRMYANAKESERIRANYQINDILYCAATLRVVFDGNKLACCFMNIHPESMRKANEISFLHEVQD